MHLAGLQSPEWIAWNIFLAVVPVIAAYLLAFWSERWKAWRKRVPWLLWFVVWLPLALAWFAFLPNTCYLLTEWRHFLFDPQYTPLRMPPGDYSPKTQLAAARIALFYLLYSSVGVLCYTLSIRPIARLLRRAHSNLLLLAIPFFFLTSLGVYMGLIVRLNSWQIITQPRIVWGVAVHALTTPHLLKTITVFAGLLWLLYEIVNIWVDGVALRLKRSPKKRAET